ncbi:hypothetical protein Tco_0340077 [Tanacetum coccineum]
MEKVYLYYNHVRLDLSIGPAHYETFWAEWFGLGSGSGLVGVAFGRSRDAFSVVIYIIDSLTQDFVMSDSEDSTVTYTEASTSPNYVPGPEHPPSPDFVSEPLYPEFMPPEDDVLPVEE